MMDVIVMLEQLRGSRDDTKECVVKIQRQQEVILTMDATVEMKRCLCMMYVIQAT